MELVINQGNWDELKSKLKKIYPQLTDDDLHHDEGMEESMLRMVEYKLRKTKEEMREIIAGIGYSPIET
jgi:uncharacterized protein YjbJ (UPF0337 family)